MEQRLSLDARYVCWIVSLLRNRFEVRLIQRKLLPEQKKNELFNKMYFIFAEVRVA